MSNNGLTAILEYPSQSCTKGLIEESIAFKENKKLFAHMKPEDAAQKYLMALFDKCVNDLKSPLAAPFADFIISPQLKSFAPSEGKTVQDRFKEKFENLGVNSVKLTKTQVVRFRQKHNNISIYGSIVTVELDKDNNLISIDSALVPDSEFTNLDLIKKTIETEDDIKNCILKDAPNIPKSFIQDLQLNPTLYYHYDSREQRWRLVYITDIFNKTNFNSIKPESLKTLANYIIDAHNGDIVSKSLIMRTIR